MRTNYFLHALSLAAALCYTLPVALATDIAAFDKQSYTSTDGTCDGSTPTFTNKEEYDSSSLLSRRRRNLLSDISTEANWEKCWNPEYFNYPEGTSSFQLDCKSNGYHTLMVYANDECSGAPKMTWELDVTTKLPAYQFCLEVPGEKDMVFEISDGGGQVLVVKYGTMCDVRKESDIFTMISLYYESPATATLTDDQKSKVQRALQKALERQAKGKTGKRLKLFISLGAIDRRRLLESGEITLKVDIQAGLDEMPTDESEIQELKKFVQGLVEDKDIENDLPEGLSWTSSDIEIVSNGKVQITDYY